MFLTNFENLIVANDTKGEVVSRCIRQLAAYGAMCLEDNKCKTPTDILIVKNNTSDADLLMQLTSKHKVIYIFAFNIFLAHSLTNLRVFRCFDVKIRYTKNAAKYVLGECATKFTRKKNNGFAKIEAT